MNPLVFNLTLLLGVVLIGVGVWLMTGMAHALIVVGALLLMLNFLSVLVAFSRKP